MPEQRRLYTPAGIALGTALGSLAAGAVLLWLNYHTLGHRRLARTVALGGAGAYLLVVILGSMLPNNVLLGSALVLLQAALAYWLADRLQGEAVRYHTASGGRTHSLLWAGGVGLLAGLAVVMLLLMITTALGIPVVAPPQDAGGS